MVEPIVLAGAVDDFERLETRERAAALNAIERLRCWPLVPGVKALRVGSGAQFRIRSGGSRILFDLVAGVPTVVRIGHRDKVYDVHPAHRQAKPV